tara:strand:- start:1445 stop:2674 length:1230 start_codon:yes stop_codon:yes gene_type:complete
MKSLIKKEYIFLTGFLSLFLSYYLGENSSGGAYLDFLSTKIFTDIFDNGIFNGFEWFLSFGQIHLPFFYLLKSILKIFFSQYEIHILYIFVSSMVPLVFYKILKKKYINSDKYYLFLLSMIIFLSPYFRSSTIWVTNDNLALLFFLISLYYFLCFQTKNKNHLFYSILSFSFLILASYIRQNYAFFGIYYLYYFFRKLETLNFIYLNFINTIISFPLLIYLYFFILKDKSEISFTRDTINFDLVFTILVFSSLYFFYFIPIIFNYFLRSNIKDIFKNNRFVLYFLIIIFLILYFFYTIPVVSFGGGVFYKLSQLININLFFIFSFFGVFFLICLNKLNIDNFLLYFVLIISFPLIFVYQKYYDPLIYIVFLILINSNFLKNLILKKHLSILSLYFYLGSFLIFSIYYNS